MENIETTSTGTVGTEGPARMREGARDRRGFGSVLRRRGRDGKLGATWYVRYSNLAGRETWEAVGPSRALAVARLSAIRLALAKEETLGVKPVVPVTFSDFLATLRPVLAARHAGSTLRTDEGRYGRIAEHFAGRPLGDLSRPDVEDFLAALRRDGAARGTCNRYLAALRLAFAEAVERGHARTDPTRGVKAVREEERPVPFVSAEDVARLAACAPADLAPAILFLGDSGLRRGEAERLGWRDVDLPRREVTVRTSKSGRPRVVPVTERAADVLARLLDARGSVPVLDGGPVFASLADGGAARLSKLFPGIAKRAGLPGLRVHDLRHGFASRLVRAGVDLPTVGRILGHSPRSLRVTLRYAAHAPEGSERAAVARLDAESRRGADGVREGVASA